MCWVPGGATELCVPIPGDMDDTASCETGSPSPPQGGLAIMTVRFLEGRGGWALMHLCRAEKREPTTVS